MPLGGASGGSKVVQTQSKNAYFILLFFVFPVILFRFSKASFALAILANTGKIRKNKKDIRHTGLVEWEQTVPMAAVAISNWTTNNNKKRKRKKKGINGVGRPS